MDKFFLDKDEVVLVIVDIQERLAIVMEKRQKVIDNCLHLIEAAKLLHIPIILTEQYPKGIGHTVKEIREALPSYEPLEKITFSCCKGPSFLDSLAHRQKKSDSCRDGDACMCASDMHMPFKRRLCSPYYHGCGVFKDRR